MEKNLEIQAIVGFKGSVINGLALHPDNEHLIYPLGSSVIIRHILTRTQTFLNGHDNQISSLAVSMKGNFLASGQQTFSGFQADLIIWDFKNKCMMHRLKLHKVLIQSVDFSYNETSLVSAGGLEDKNTINIWDVEMGKAIYSHSFPGNEPISCVKFFNKSDKRLITVQENAVYVVTLEPSRRKVTSEKVNFGTLKRVFKCVTITHDDRMAYLGTTSGDILEVNLDTALFSRIGPINKLFSMGVVCLRILNNGDLIAGAGDGTLGKISIHDMKTISTSCLMGAVTSISFTADYTYFFSGTAQSNVYWVDTSNLNPELRNTCHSEKINDIAFPYKYSGVFATCSMNDIRLWNTKNRQELLRIQVLNLECICLCFLKNGTAIISGWSDGKIRSFLPQSGKLQFVINDAHLNGVSALAVTRDNTRIVSGGFEGEVRVWKISTETQHMQASLKEHRGRIWDIKLTKNDETAVSASSDGSCILWDIKNSTRLMCFFESTLFKQVVYHPEETQLLTTGSDRKLSYWDVIEGQAIRMLDGSDEGEMNALDITEKGHYIASGGADKLLKLWDYDLGLATYKGLGHSGAINKIRISPDQSLIVSVGSEGAIIFWKSPPELIVNKEELDELELLAKEMVFTDPRVPAKKNNTGSPEASLKKSTVVNKSIVTSALKSPSNKSQLFKAKASPKK